MRRSVWLIVVALLPLFSSPCFAAIDEVQAKLLEYYGLPLRWDNVEGPPEWVNGEKPTYSFKRRMHILHFEPGTSVLVRIPPNEMLRVMDLGNHLTPDDLEIAVSNGSGLYAYLPVQQSLDGHSLIVSPETSDPLLAQIRRPVQSQDAIEAAIFVSRRETLGEIAPYRMIVDLPVATVKIKDSHQPRSRTFWAINRHEPVEIEIQGPVRLDLENRCIYPSNESRRSQTYRIFLSIDDNLSQMLEFETQPEMDYPVYVDGTLRITGRLENGYLEIPEGKHTLVLQAAADLYARLLMQEQSDYLLAEFNQPEPNAAEVRKQNSPQVLSKSLWELQEQELQDVAAHTESSPASLERVSMRIARDNTRREGGLLGAMLLKNAADRYQENPLVHKHAEKLLGMHTFYRDLLPSKKLTPEPQQFYRFPVRRLKKLPDQEQDVVVAEQHLDELLDSLPGAYFVEIPAHPSGEKTTYRLPPRFSPSFLRVIARTTSLDGQEFLIQFDNSPPLRFRMTPEVELPEPAYQFSLGEIGLTLLHQQYPQWDAATLGGPYSINHTPASLISAGIYELPLPKGVRSIHVFASDSDADPNSRLMVALQYRTSKPYTFSEIEFLSIIEYLTDNLSDQQILTMFFETLQFPWDQISSSEQFPREINLLKKELINCWLPLIRLLRSQARMFEASIAPLPPRNQTKQRSPSEIEDLIRQARTAEAEGQWPIALEIWTHVYNGTDLPIKENAQFSRIKALRYLGEGYLAEHLLREIFLYNPEVAYRTTAFEQLEELYQETEDHEALFTLYASAIMHQPTFRTIRDLIEILVKDGKYHMALMLGLIVPETEQSALTMLRAAFQLGWWNVFDTILNRLENDNNRHYWIAQRAWRKGQYEEAMEHFHQAGTIGEQWGRIFENGIAIHADLTSSDIDNQAKAVIEWERWQAEYPGPFVWREAAHLVTDYAGTETLYSVSRDLYTQAFRATMSNPVKLRIIGPINLRVEARPLHAKDSASPVDGWLYIRESDRLHVFPFNRNLPTTNIQITEDDQWAAGRKISVEYAVEPGLHEIEISSETFPVLTQIFVKEPEIRSGILPPLTVDTLQALSTLQAQYHFAGAINEVLELSQGYDDKDVLQRMTLLLWLAEKHPERYPEMLVQAESLFFEYPEVPGLQTLLSRLTRNSEWTPITFIQSSAGLRYLDVLGWQPESPSLRVRKTLLAPFDPHDHVLYDENPLLLSLNNVASTELEVFLTVEDVASLPAHPIRVTCQLNDNLARIISLTPDEPQYMFHMPIPAGEHYLRLGIDTRVENQFVRIQLHETTTEQTHSESDKMILAQERKRAYHVATPTEPVQFEVEGPAWVRIDELRDGRTWNFYRDIGPGWHSIDLTPAPDREEALVRLYQKTVVTDSSPTLVRNIQETPEPVPDPLFEILSAKAGTFVELHDQYPLGGQEDGTWTLSANVARRRNVQEDQENQNKPEEFFEFSATQRHFHEYRRFYSSSQILGRIRRDGGPTIGGQEHIYYRPASFPFDLRLTGNLHMQRPEAFDSGDLEWSGELRASLFQIREIGLKTDHIPSLSIFGRYLSMDDDEDYDAGSVDQDIFTPYKADHKTGIRLADTLTHRPWLDTLWFAEGSVTSNENYNLFAPDHVSLGAGWKQLMGAFQFDVRCHYTHYFSDDDRESPINRYVVGGNLSAHKWFSNQYRLEVKLEIEHEFESGESAGMFYVLWHFGNGRAYRDFRPGEIDFLAIRKRQVPHKKNNWMSNVE